MFLNDFGSAVPEGEETYFEGALQRAPERILQAVKDNRSYKPKKSDDFEMIVRLLYERVNPSEFEAIRGNMKTEDISEFWKVTFHFVGTSYKLSFRFDFQLDFGS